MHAGEDRVILSAQPEHPRDAELGPLYAVAGIGVIAAARKLEWNPVFVGSTASYSEIIHELELVKHGFLPLLQLNQIIISPIHLAVMKQEILEKMMEKKITALSFENLKDDSGHNPIVRSMSEIAGSAVMQEVLAEPAMRKRLLDALERKRTERKNAWAA